MEITIWDRQIKNDEGELIWVFNHISDGYNETQTHPKPVTVEQGKGWAKSKWRSEKAQLINSVVTR